MVATDGETGRGQDMLTIFYVIYRKSVMSAQMLEVSLLGVGTVLHLERNAWSMVKWQRHAIDEYTPPPRPPM